MKFGEIYRFNDKLTFLGRAGYVIYGFPFIGSYLRSLYFKEMLKFICFKTVLDAGCGAGEYSFYLADKYPNIKIDAIDSDLDHDYVNDIIRKTGIRNISFKKEDLFDINPVSKYDLIFSIDVLEHIKDNEIILKKLYQALNPSGHIIIHMPQRNWDRVKILNPEIFTSFNKFVKKEHPGQLYDAHQLKALLIDIGFEVKEMLETFGYFGKMAWEIDQFLKEKSLYFLGMLSLPMLKILCHLDLVAKQKRGSGAIIIAKKNIKV